LALFSFGTLDKYSTKSTAMAISMAMSMVEISKDSVGSHHGIKMRGLFIGLMNCKSLF
jgi:hypothetical protein